MGLLILVAVLVILGILAHYFGVDSREGFDRHGFNRPPPLR
jgi:hypothetical protein